MFGAALSLYPPWGAESSRVTATAEYTPGSTSTVISPLKNGGRGVCVCVCTEGRDSDTETETVMCECGKKVRQKAND